MELIDRIKTLAFSKYKRNGFRSVTLDDIAQELGISKKTIYQYFADKDTLVNAIMDDELENDKQCCIADSKNAENAVHEIFLAMKMMQQTFADMKPMFLFELKKYHFSAFAKFEKFKNEFLYNVIKANLERGITEGLYRQNLNTDIITAMRLETVTLIFSDTLLPTDKYSIIAIEEQLATHFLHGIATIKGLKMIEKYSKQIFEQNKKQSI